MYSVNVSWFFIMSVSTFGNLRIEAYLQLPAAYRSLSRPSSAPDAKAFTLCSCSLELPSFELTSRSTLFSRSYLNCLSFFKTWIIVFAAIRFSFLLSCFASPCWFLSWQNCFYPLIGKTWSLVSSRKQDSSLSSLSVFSYSIFRFIRFSMSMKLSLHELQHLSYRMCD